MKTLSISDFLPNTFTNITWIVLEILGSEKHIFFSYFSQNNVSREYFWDEQQLNKKNNIFHHPVSCKAAKRLKIYQMLTNFISCDSLGFPKICLNIYGLVKNLFKNAEFFYALFPFNSKGFHPNCTILSENMTKHIENIVCKFQTNTFNA